MRGVDIGRKLSLEEIEFLRARNIEVIFRYIGPFPKATDPSEISMILSRGIGVMLIGQKTANFPGYFTPAQGAQDGADYRQWSLELGAPLGIPILFPVDTDMSDPATEANGYFNAAYGGLDGAYDLGVYGENDLVEGVARFYGGVTYTWQTPAWSHGIVSQIADAYQFGSLEIKPGLVVDLNVVRTDPQWRLARGTA